MRQFMHVEQEDVHGRKPGSLDNNVPPSPDFIRPSQRQDIPRMHFRGVNRLIIAHQPMADWGAVLHFWEQLGPVSWLRHKHSTCRGKIRPNGQEFTLVTHVCEVRPCLLSYQPWRVFVIWWLYLVGGNAMFRSPHVCTHHNWRGSCKSIISSWHHKRTTTILGHSVQ